VFTSVFTVATCRRLASRAPDRRSGGRLPIGVCSTISPPARTGVVSSFQSALTCSLTSASSWSYCCYAVENKNNFLRKSSNVRACRDMGDCFVLPVNPVFYCIFSPVEICHLVRVQSISQTNCIDQRSTHPARHNLFQRKRKQHGPQCRYLRRMSTFAADRLRRLQARLNLRPSRLSSHGRVRLAPATYPALFDSALLPHLDRSDRVDVDRPDGSQRDLGTGPRRVP